MAIKKYKILAGFGVLSSVSLISLITVKGELGAKMKEEEKLTKWKQEFQFGFVCNNEIIFSQQLLRLEYFSFIEQQLEQVGLLASRTLGTRQN